MARARTVEILVGAFMLVGLLALLFLAMKVSNLSATARGEGYHLTARFDNIGTLKKRAPVTMAGVRIGRIAEIGLDTQTYEAVVVLHIDQQFDTIPVDSFASIFTAGLLGEQYVGLDPGGSQEFLRDGDRIGQTQSALVLEQMIAQFLFNKAEEGTE